VRYDGPAVDPTVTVSGLRPEQIMETAAPAPVEEFPVIEEDIPAVLAPGEDLPELDQ